MSTEGDDLRRRATAMQESAIALNVLAAKLDAVPRPLGNYVTVLTEILYGHGLCVVAQSALTLAHRAMVHVEPDAIIDSKREDEYNFTREFNLATEAVDKALKGNQ